MKQEDLPKGWIRTTLVTVCSVNSGIGFPKIYQGIKQEKYPFYKVGDISRTVQNGNLWLTESNHSVSQNICELLKGKPFPDSTIVFAKIGEALKLNRRAITSTYSLIDNNVMGLIPKKNIIEVLYLYYFFVTIKLGDLSRSTTVPSIRKTDVENLMISFPPLSEQKRIVSKIESIFAQIDASKEKLEVLVSQTKSASGSLNMLRSSILKRAFEGKLVPQNPEDEPASVLLEKIRKENPNLKQSDYEEIDQNNLPKGWVRTLLSQIAIINPSKPNSGSVSPNLDVSFVPMRLVEELTGKINLSEIRKYAQVKKGYTYFRDGDIIFAKITPCMENGKIAIVDGAKNGMGFGSTEFHVVRLKHYLSTKFYFWYLIQEEFRNKVERKMKGTAGQLRVPSEVMRQELVPIPSLSEQKRIVSKIESIFAKIDAYKNRLKHGITNQMNGFVIS